MTNYKYLFGFLALISVLVWMAVFSVDDNLQVIACDVGQGDAILIQKQTTQVLIDGGPDSSVLSCLGKYMPFWDKTIELVVLTHPQEDHYGGLIDVFKTYKVAKFGENNTNSSNISYGVLKKLVGGLGVDTLELKSGMLVRLGMIHLDILHPKQLNSNIDITEKKSNSNDNGLVILLKYAQFKALFTADVEIEVSDELSTNSKIQNIEYIKVNHHGSRNGLSQKLLNSVSPKVAVISSGSGNSYGHPHAEVIKMINDYGVVFLRTDEIGHVVVTTNGLNIWYR